MDKLNFIKDKVKYLEEITMNYEKTKDKLVDEILGLIESIPEKDFELNMLYIKAILCKNDEYSLDDALWILKNMDDNIKNDYEWNYLMAKINFEIGVYDDAKEYVDKIIGIDENDNKVKELSKKIQNMYEYEIRKK